jgi:hypothetical protein
MSERTTMASERHEQSARGEQAVLLELKGIKRLLALLLLRDGAGQQQVARAAGVAKAAINQLANVGTVSQKAENRKLRKK